MTRVNFHAIVGVIACCTASPLSLAALPSIRAATSDDKLAFRPASGTAIADADAPDVVRLPNGNLLAVVDRYTGQETTPRLSVSQSADDGATWTTPRPLRFRNAPFPLSAARHGSLIVTPDGLVRLYFTAPVTARGGLRGETAVCSAVTRNGLDYDFDPHVCLPSRRGGDLYPCALQTPRMILLYLTETPPADRRGRRDRPFTSIWQSNDGRRFVPAGELREPILPCDLTLDRDGRIRLFFAADVGIRSMASPDGIRWRPEDGVRIEGVYAATVTALDENRQLMLCVVPAERNMLRDKHEPPPGESQTPGNDAAAVATAQVPMWQPFTQTTPDQAFTDDAPIENQWPDDMAPVVSPLERVDYLQWLKNNVTLPPDDNAYQAYESLLNEMITSEVQDPFHNMFEDRDAPELPGPWDPAEHPEWEASYQANLNWTDRYRQAALDPRPFNCPLMFSMPGQPEPDNTDLPLYNILLPGLAQMRRLSRATLSNGWRMENGAVSPDNMRQSWKTVLANADHLRGDLTIIGQLVSIAEQSFVERNARFALQQDVFQTPEELEAALLTLRDTDPPYAGAARGITGEHAMTMDATQYPLRYSESGPLEIDPDRMDQYYSMVHGGSPNLLERMWLGSLSPDDFLEAAQDIDRYYRQLKPMWEAGYPEYREEDVAELTSSVVNDTNQISKILLPSLSRAYLLMNRAEASRRATQLTYGIHLFKARHGRLPNSLDELPPELDPEARTDPFSGTDFVYWLNDDGTFTLYSTANNGQDDGGFHNPDRRLDPDIESDDIVYWPPN